MSVPFAHFLALFPTLSHFPEFSEFHLQDFFLELRGFPTVFVQRDEKRIKENKEEKTKPFCTLVVARLSSSEAKIIRGPSLRQPKHGSMMGYLGLLLLLKSVGPLQSAELRLIHLFLTLLRSRRRHSQQCCCHIMTSVLSSGELKKAVAVSEEKIQQHSRRRGRFSSSHFPCRKMPKPW